MFIESKKGKIKNYLMRVELKTPEKEALITT